MRKIRLAVYIAVFLIFYLLSTDWIETKKVYPYEQEWFTFSINQDAENVSCLDTTVSYLIYRNRVDETLGFDAPNVVSLSLHLVRSCQINKATIWISATDLMFPIVFNDSLNLGRWDNGGNDSLNISLSFEPNSPLYQEIKLGLPINKSFYNHYRIYGVEGIKINLVGLEYKDDIFNGYYAEEDSFSMIEGQIKQELPIFMGKYKRYEFEDNTTHVLFRFTPKVKRWVLVQKMLDAIILGLISVFIYDLFKGRFTSPK